MSFFFLFALYMTTFLIHTCTSSQSLAPAHSSRHVCVAAEQQQACCIRPGSNQRPAVLQQAGGPRN